MEKEKDFKLSKEGKRNVALNSLIKLIPHIGGALANSYFGYKQEKRLERLEKFYSELALKIQEEQIELVAFENHNQEILISLVEELNEQVEKEALEEKRKLLKNYFKNLLTSPTQKSNYDLRKFFLFALNQLSLVDIELMVELQHGNSSLINDLKLIEEHDTYLVFAAVSKLESLALITTAQRDYATHSDDEDNFDDERNYKLIKSSTLGQKFTDFCMNK